MRQLMNVGSGGAPLLDIASYGRKGPGRRDHLSVSDIELIRRTVNRTPEVMVKVLTRGGQNLKAVRAHLAYLNRGGDVDIETDGGERLSEKGVDKELLQDWNLDLEEHRRGSRLGPRADRTPPKLAHKILFSMPPGTPATKVLAAVKNFAKEEFGLKHRYAMVLHTDEPHPHVHMVVKAISEDGVRLNIRKETLRGWRREFARHLRGQGVAANATERAVRGEIRTSYPDGIHRANLRGDSRYVTDRTEKTLGEIGDGPIRTDSARATLIETRREVERGWTAVRDLLIQRGDHDLARRIGRFTARMAAPSTDTDLIVAKLSKQSRESALRP